MSATEKAQFISNLEKAIRFHQTNPNDPHNIGNAVIASLQEVLEAFTLATAKAEPKAVPLPQLDEVRSLAIELFNAAQAEERRLAGRWPDRKSGWQEKRWRDLTSESVAVWDAVARQAFNYFRT